VHSWNVNYLDIVLNIAKNYEELENHYFSKNLCGWLTCVAKLVNRLKQLNLLGFIQGFLAYLSRFAWVRSKQAEILFVANSESDTSSDWLRNMIWQSFIFCFSISSLSSFVYFVVFYCSVMFYCFLYFIYIYFSLLCYFHFYIHGPLFLYAWAFLWWCKNITINIHKDFIISLSSFFLFFPFW
jgi:hypothetical protein